MKRDSLASRLDHEKILRLSRNEWEQAADQAEILERHDTRIAGELLLIRLEQHLAAVERPEAGKRVVRRLADEEEARRFIEERLETYDRMWDGCGCKVDYYR